MGDDNARRSGFVSRSNDISNSSSNLPMEISIAEASSMFPGFRFSPTDRELIQYLKKKLRGSHDGVEVISEVDICKFEPWDLPAHSVIKSENEWFFFSPRGKKYPNGSQSKRATPSGYWKATGKERIVKSGSKIIGTKRTLVFHIGRAPKGQRTEWLMHEYCTSEKSQDGTVVCRLRKNSDLNDSLRRNYLAVGNLPAANNSTTTTTLSDVEQPGILEGAKIADSFSKEGSSSYYPRSIELVDGVSESDDKRTSEFSQNDCSSIDHKFEDDFYADIMKDDIINLDDSSLNTNPEVRWKFDMQSTQADEATTSSHPLQATANRRLLLGRQTRKTTKSVSIENAPHAIPQKTSDDLPGSSPITRINFPSIFLFLVTIILLILLPLFIDGYRATTSILKDALKFGRSSSSNCCG